MVAYLTVDSSVIIASLIKQEKRHSECKSLMEKVKNGHIIALEPSEGHRSQGNGCHSYPDCTIIWYFSN